MITGLNKLWLYVLTLKIASDADRAENPLHSINQSCCAPPPHPHHHHHFKKILHPPLINWCALLRAWIVYLKNGRTYKEHGRVRCLSASSTSHQPNHISRTIGVSRRLHPEVWRVWRGIREVSILDADCPRNRCAGAISFLRGRGGGGGNMLICRVIAEILGGHRHISCTLRWKVGGAIGPLPPPPPLACPCPGILHESIKNCTNILSMIQAIFDWLMNLFHF